ncbi:universal stress protein [Halorubrum sp. JWXQ-INN 858]|uniref:universal stress protein n=1 Tax=Halorubrum sp. JWXQ-INN 858 TaxID=2690782 RepID=UPI001356FF62|nr:universal stress protein [Halorubrum sp. JWXQ-INN 858]MWV65741.1 universal stress protein [Halorubrum sp. JWXQ-INN 858]
MYDSILVPTDGSRVANNAVDHAVDLAEKYDAEIHALFVADTDMVAYSLGTEQVDRIRQGNFGEMTELREDAQEATGYVRERGEAAGIEVVERHAGGRPHDVIADYARDNDIDLIVMGSHGRSGVRRALLGSVTERTLRSTHVPVFVVDYVEGR